MTYEDDNFVGVFRDVYPEGFCEHLIQQFDKLEANSIGANRLKSENTPAHRKNDHQISFGATYHNLEDFNQEDTRRIFFQGLQRCYDEYVKDYSVLSDIKISCSSMKMQRTPPGGGYHVWHAEHGPGESVARVLVYMLYLNDLEEGEGGETEFLYLRKRFHPTANTILVWPAGYTHAHRGNMVLGERSKYVVTGWFYFE
jgi:hypothetical protein